MSNTHLIIGDQHAHYQYSNDRADWLAKLIISVNPDVVVNIGDGADMPSLSSYDKGKKSFHGRSYRADILAHLDFQDRLWFPIIKRKKKLPRRVYLIGNHEERINKAVNLQPELEGTIGLGDLHLDRFYDDIVHYVGNTPGVINVDGINYAHYFVSGLSGRPIFSEHPAYSLVTKNFASCTQGHNHLIDFCQRKIIGQDQRVLNGLTVGCYQDYNADWAGETNRLWWRGIVVKRNVEDGNYDPEFISLERIKKEFNV